MPHSSMQIIRQEHASLGAMLQSMRALLDHGPGDEPETYFDVLRAMLFYIDEFPERSHHPKESRLLFPRVLAAVPSLQSVVERLEHDHQQGEQRVRQLQHHLLAWELLGESRRAAFVQPCQQYLAFYLEHMHIEETQILPEAERVLATPDWRVLDMAFSDHGDPLTGSYPHDPIFYRLYTHIVKMTPALLAH